MIKHLVIAVTLLTGCDGWFVPCDQAPPGTVYCTVSGDPPGPCEAPGIPYYVWSIDWQCAEVQQLVCASNDADAQAQVDQMFGDETHGAISKDPHATEPKQVTVCGTGANCVLGSSDESLGTTFWVFTDDQIPLCEQQLDPNCSWSAPQDDGTCPGA